MYTAPNGPRPAAHQHHGSGRDRRRQRGLSMASWRASRTRAAQGPALHAWVRHSVSRGCATRRRLGSSCTESAHPVLGQQGARTGQQHCHRGGAQPRLRRRLPRGVAGLPGRRLPGLQARVVAAEGPARRASRGAWAARTAACPALACRSRWGSPPSAPPRQSARRRTEENRAGPTGRRPPGFRGLECGTAGGGRAPNHPCL